MTQDIIFILIALTVTALLGYLLGRQMNTVPYELSYDEPSETKEVPMHDQDSINQLQEQLDALKNENNVKQLEIEKLQMKLAARPTIAPAASNGNGGPNTNGESSTLPDFMTMVPTTPDAELHFDPEEARAVFGKKILADDLKIIEGIGPKIASILMDEDIKTWYHLSRASPASIVDILVSFGGDSYKIHDPATWPRQAALAHTGKWQELKDYQGQLKGGKEIKK